MYQDKTVMLLGYASGIGAGDPGCANGPVVLEQSDLLANLAKLGWHSYWEAMLYPVKDIPILSAVTEINRQLATLTKKAVEQRQFFTVFAGDHSCAIGTWSGVAAALKSQGPIGLLWFDAHMDAHTFETTPSGNIHGMPVASLLGFGAKELINIIDANPKLLPEHICLIGIRSFEKGEAELLTRLGIRIYMIEEIQRRGLNTVVQEALAKVKRDTAGFGVSIDLDAIDPSDAPGVGTPEINGINSMELINALSLINNDSKYIGAEITEYNPLHDHDQLTLQLIYKILSAVLPKGL